ncbi:SDR family oxidoreductase [Natronospirillum operosum]|uniref:SDR family oxidoreductase n=1 Tax=Natronospirillum operosum TaxID=2759953 RepID=A0A4Z0W5I5_9GAMM|nr:SDR family oxidoreductase [Natronospirillum operosum]TGG91159.1 SDR family oxidoreductase [Natronospirillum operosum]
MQIEDAVIVITGGARGLGRAMALRLAGQGARLALIDLDASGLQDTAEACRQAGGDARAYELDITDEGAVETTFARIRQDYGRLDGLINNAGVLMDGLLIKVKDGKLEKKMSGDQFRKLIDINLTGTFLCGREAAAIMAEDSNGGVIINMASVSRAGNMGQSNYSAAKAGVSAMTVTWAKELARYRIRVAAIAPGAIATDMTAQMKPEALQRMEQMAMLGRLGEQDEIAHSAQYIFENDFFTGRILEVDGGTRV